LLVVIGIYKFLSLANSGRSCRFEKSSKVMIKIRGYWTAELIKKP
jgi:hypothetical protein